MAEEQKLKTEGAFVASLKRNNKQIKDDRATAIADMAQMRYRRQVEDMEMEIKCMRRDRDNMLDLSPDNTQSLMVAKNFNDAEFVKRDLELGIKIRNAEIALEIADTQYKHLFKGSK